MNRVVTLSLIGGVLILLVPIALLARGGGGGGRGGGGGGGGGGGRGGGGGGRGGRGGDPHADAAHLADGVGPEHPIAPSHLGDVLRDEVAGEEPALLAVTEELTHPVHPVDELPVRRHHLDAERVGDPHHVLAAAPEGGRRALTCVAAVEEQRLPGPLGSRALDERGEVGVTAHPAVARRQRREVEVRRGVRLDGARRDVVGPEELGAGEERRLAVLSAYTDERVGLAVVEGAQRRVRIGEVEQGDVAERLELEEPLGAVGGLEPTWIEPRRRGHREELQEVAAAEAETQ